MEGGEKWRNGEMDERALRQNCQAVKGVEGKGKGKGKGKGRGEARSREKCHIPPHTRSFIDMQSTSRAEQNVQDPFVHRLLIVFCLDLPSLLPRAAPLVGDSTCVSRYLSVWRACRRGRAEEREDAVLRLTWCIGHGV